MDKEQELVAALTPRQTVLVTLLNAANTFVSVVYVDPFAPRPMGFTETGVIASLTGTGVPAGDVAYAQLLENETPIAYGTGATANAVRVLNPRPLASTLSYTMQVQFAASGKKPQDLDWSNPANIASAPVITQQARVRELTVTSSGFDFSWDIPSGSQIGGIYLQLINLTKNALTGDYYLGSDANASVSASLATDSFAVRISPIQPITGTSTGGFASPYSIGPPSPPQIIPAHAPTLSAISFDGNRAEATWTAPTVPAGTIVTLPRYELMLLSGTSVVMSAMGGATGGALVTGDISTVASPSLAARTIYDSFVGANGTSIALGALAPEPVSVSVTSASQKSSIAATFATPSALSTSNQLVATLYTNGVAGTPQTLSAAPATVTWSNISPAADSVYAIEARMVTSTNSKTSTGPASSPVSIPLATPTVSAADYDGEILTLDLAFASETAADGYAITVTDGTTPQHFTAGPSMPVRIPCNLDLSKTWSVTARPTIGIIQGTISASHSVTLPTLAAPVLKSVVYDGEQLHLAWSAASLPYLDGYLVKVAHGSTNKLTVTTGSETVLSIPLAKADAAGAAVTVTGTSALRNSAASTAVDLITDVITMGLATVTASTVTATWTTAGSGTVEALLTIDGTVVDTPSGATATGVSFTTPSDKTQKYGLQARLISADKIAAGPLSGAAELILQTPALLSAELGTSGMDLAWTADDTAAIETYELKATTSASHTASVTVDGTRYSGPTPAEFLEAGTLTITPKNAHCTGPARSVSILAQASVSSGSYDGKTLSLHADVGAVSQGNIYWLDVFADGGLLARKSFVATANPFAQPFTIDVGIPDGAAVTARITGIGPHSLTPGSADMAVPSSIPTLTSAAYDGSKLHVAWQPKPGPGTGGYVVSVAGGSPAIPDTYVSGANSASTAITTSSISYPFGANVAVSIRAASGQNGSAATVTGQPGTAQKPVLAGYGYGTGVKAAGDPPYLFRSGTYQTLNDVSGNVIELYLPKPFTGSANPTVSSTSANAFKLSPSPSGSALPYKLTIGTDAWTTLGSNGVRTSLRTSYIGFLNDVEDTGVFPWAIALLRQMIAEAMPQTFEEVLYYRYGLWHDNSLRVADLTPGTRLQVSNAVYQSPVGGTNEKNGYVATGTEIMDLASAIPQSGASTLAAGPNRSLSVDTFLSLMYPGSGTGTDKTPVAAGAIDFFDGQNRQAYYRLFYPADFLSSGSTGSNSAESNVALAGAATWKKLDTITQAYATSGTFPNSNDYFLTYFRGRSAITPLINIAIQSEQRWVPLGTTVRQLLSAQGLAPYFGGNGGDQIAMTRASANLFAYPDIAPSLSLDPINLTNSDLGNLTPLYWPLDMPVVGGDQISLKGSQTVAP
ncbi:hypothetical protein [Coralliovum pocilloporae]|uniref:hypothetical protein n=1 Tax=Coralliovum pocilloporae TaxID=3066369 RepID=UPI0033071C87